MLPPFFINFPYQDSLITLPTHLQHQPYRETTYGPIVVVLALLLDLNPDSLDPAA